MTIQIQGRSETMTIPTPDVSLEGEANESPVFGKIVNIQKAQQITTLMRPSQPAIGFCPTPDRHFFCGTASKLGCKFCAKT